jgi:hypothetical protein
MTRLRIGRPTPALALSSLALLVALGGTSYAAFALPKNSVGTKQLKRGAVTGAKLAGGAVTAAKIGHGAVTAAKLNVSGVTVPNALHSGSADSATNASNATNAGNAANATNLNGQPASAYKAQWVEAEGNTTIDAQSGGITVVRPPATAGEYYVTFPNSVAGRAMSATLRWGPSQGNGGGDVLVSLCDGGSVDITCTGQSRTNTVFVETDSNSGAPVAQDHGFFLAVLP